MFCVRFRKPVARRAFSTAGSSVDGIAKIHSIPLTESVPWVPAPKFASIPDHQYETQVTVLDNGMRVATEPKFGQFCTVGGKYAG